MAIGKYVTNVSVLGALMGALGTARQAQAMPKDWRRFVVWGVWAAGLVLAIVGVAKQADDEEFEAEQRELEREAKAEAKALKRR